MASQDGWDPEPTSQPASSGWDDEDPLPHTVPNPGRVRNRNRTGGSRARAALGSLPQNSVPPDTWGLEPTASQEGQDGWGDPISTSTPGSVISNANLDSNLQKAQSCIGEVIQVSQCILQPV